MAKNWFSTLETSATNRTFFFYDHASRSHLLTVLNAHRVQCIVEGTAVCNVLAMSATRAPLACATMTVTFGRRYLDLDSLDLTLAIVYDRQTRCVMPCFAALSWHMRLALLADTARTLQTAVSNLSSSPQITH